MKIGKFAAINNLSIDSIRHYSDIGLIIPQKQGGQYNFDERCQKDLEDILELKAMGFTLGEIKSIFYFKRLGNLANYQEGNGYREIFNNKFKQVSNEIEKLEKRKSILGEKLIELASNEMGKYTKLGVDIKSLNIFRCNKCGREMNLAEGNVCDNQVIKGKLRCGCGEEYVIDDGIVLVNTQESAGIRKISYEHLSEYINDTSSEYIDNICKSMEWMYNRIDFNELADKTVLDLGSGLGFYTRLIYSDLPDSTFYLTVDHDLGVQRFLKGILEMLGYKKNIIFICSDFLEIPIKRNSIDVLFDIGGTSNYSFEHEEFLLKHMERYVKKECLLLGQYILFKNFSEHSLIDKKVRKNFLIDNIKKEIKALKYMMIDDTQSNYIESGGKYEDYFISGEKVYGYLYKGKR